MERILRRIIVVCIAASAALLVFCSGTQNALAACDHHWVEVHADSPTCTKNGASYQECSLCSEQRTVAKPAAGHQWGQVGYTAPSCKPGAYYYECSVCSAQKTEQIPANGNHSWKKVRVEEPTCANEGASYLECAVCSAQKTEKIPATGEHNWKEVQRTAPTCTASGTRYIECSRCGEEKTEKIKALGHDWKEVQYTAPTCTASGTRYIECSRCREQKTEKVPATGKHTYTEISRTNATCYTDGKAVKKCSVCGKEETEILKAENAHKWEEVSRIPATCSKSGSRELRCTACGRTKTETLSATGKHKYGDWVVVKKAAGQNADRRERVCDTCGKVESEDIRPNGEKKESGDTVRHSDSDAVTVYTSAAKVNLRQGPSRKAKRKEQIAKKNTYLGELQGAEIDSDGTVWYQILYKNKKRYVTSEFAYAVCGTPTGGRTVTGSAAELDHILLKAVDSVLEKLNLIGRPEDGYECAASADGLVLYGNTVVEKVELSGSAYTFFGVKVGDHASSARKTLRDAGLWLEKANDDQLIFEHVCSPDSLAITELGFDSVLMLEIDDGKVISMTWEAYTE